MAAELNLPFGKSSSLFNSVPSTLCQRSTPPPLQIGSTDKILQVIDTLFLLHPAYILFLNLRGKLDAKNAG